jgi:predicted transcriptional regulator
MNTLRKPGALSKMESYRRSVVIKKMIREKKTQTDIAKALGISQSSVCKFISRRQAVLRRLQTTLSAGVNQSRPGVIKETRDATRLDPEQTLRSIRLGIDPERMAWLLSCKAENKMVSRKRGVRRG